MSLPLLTSPLLPPLQREVLRNKDASSLPPTLCLMVTIQCFSWGVYGWVRNDWSTFSNNAVGVVLGLIQLTLIGMYGNKRAHISGGVGAVGAVSAAGGADAVAAASAPVLDIIVDKSPKSPAADNKQR